MLFSTAVREIEDLMHNWKVFFKVINKDSLHFINKVCIVFVIVRDETKRIVLNISITVNNGNNFTLMVTLEFTLHKELVIFSKIPKNNHVIHICNHFIWPHSFRLLSFAFFLGSQKIFLTFA